MESAWGQHLGLSPVIESAAANIVQTKLRWKQRPSQSLTRLVKLCRDQQSTDVRDKIYALHGLSNDTDDMIVDYGITARQLLDVVVKHTCEPCETVIDLWKSRKQILRTAQLLRDVLGVHCNDQELQVIIDAEENGMVIRDDLRKADEAHIRAQAARQDVMSDARRESTWSTTVGEQKASLESKQGHCLFEFLHCPFRSPDKIKWRAHCLDHFLLEEPPSGTECPLCHPPKRSRSIRSDAQLDLVRAGDTTWAAHLQHYQDAHERSLSVYRSLVNRRLLQHLFGTGILDETELRALHRDKSLSKMPARYASAADDADTDEEELPMYYGIQRNLRAETGIVAKRLVAVYNGTFTSKRLDEPSGDL
jgi:hypothetical protein